MKNLCVGRYTPIFVITIRHFFISSTVGWTVAVTSTSESYAFRDGWITIALNCEVKMKTRLNPGSVLGILSSVAILVLICAPVYGQWVKVPTGRIPRGPEGKPNLSAPAPRSPDGHPDLSGVWESGSAKYILDI